MTSLKTRRLELITLAPEVISDLLRGDRSGAQRILRATLPGEFPTPDDLRGLLPIQLQRIQQSPDRRDWLARLMLKKSGEIVGHCGFHGPPDVIGRAEIGYTVFTPFRGQGFAKEAANALVQWAFAQGEHEVFASVSPHNAPFLAVVRSLGFTQVGTQEDEVDGLELVFSLRSDRTS
jgi:RimJ/RimL family protein N-acetyltransferase